MPITKHGSSCLLAINIIIIHPFYLPSLPCISLIVESRTKNILSAFLQGKASKHNGSPPYLSFSYFSKIVICRQSSLLCLYKRIRYTNTTYFTLVVWLVGWISVAFTFHSSQVGLWYSYTDLCKIRDTEGEV
jgi:hypothetical protein